MTAFFSVHTVHNPLFHSLVASAEVGVRNFSARDPQLYPRDALDEIFKARKYNVQISITLGDNVSAAQLAGGLSAELTNLDADLQLKDLGFRTFIKNKTVDAFSSITLPTFTLCAPNELKAEFSKVNINYVSEGQRDRKAYHWRLRVFHEGKPLFDMLSTPFKAVGRATSLVRESPSVRKRSSMSSVFDGSNGGGHTGGNTSGSQSEDDDDEEEQIQTPPQTVYEPIPKAARLTPLAIPPPMLTVPKIRGVCVVQNNNASSGSVYPSATMDQDTESENDENRNGDSKGKGSPMTVLHACIDLLNGLNNPLERSCIAKMVYEKFVSPGDRGSSSMSSVSPVLTGSNSSAFTPRIVQRVQILTVNK